MRQTDYYVQGGYLVHAEERKKHKYYAKVKISEDKTRYFYSKEEYLAYLKNQHKGKDGKTIGERGRGAVEGFLAKAAKTADDAKKGLSRAASDAKKGLSKFASDVKEEAFQAVDKVAKAIQNGKQAVNNAMKKTTKAVSEFAASGKEAATKAMKKVKNTTVQTLDKAKKIAGDVKKGASKALSKAKKKTFEMVGKAKKAASNVGKSLDKAKKSVSKSLNKSVKSISKFAEKGKKAVSANFKKATSSLSKFVAKGKRKVAKLLPKAIKDKIKATKKQQARRAQLRNEHAREAKARVQQATTPARKAALDRGHKHQNARGKGDEKDYTVQAAAMRKSLAEISKNDPFHHFDKKNGYASRADDLLSVNPNYEYNPFSPYAENCSYCGVTYEMRRRGYDVEAKPLADDDLTEILRQWTMYEQFDISEKEISALIEQGREPYESKINQLAEKHGIFTNRIFSDIINKRAGRNKINPNEVQTNGDIIKDNISSLEMSKISTEYMRSQGEGARGIINVYWNNGGGHCMNWEVVNGQAIIYDSQTNETHTVLEICERSVPHTIYRTDNLELSDEITDWVTRSSGRKNQYNRKDKKKAVMQ